MRIGIMAGIATTALWALSFVAPEMVPDVDAFLLTGLRYACFGAVATLAGWRRLRRVARADHGRALLHALTGNVGHYLLAVVAVRLAGAAVVVAVIALLPVAFAVIGGREEQRPVRRMLPALGVVVAGIVLVQAGGAGEPGAADLGASVLGGLVALASAAAWLWYGLDSARFLRTRPDIGATTWASAVGVATGVLSVPMIAIGAWLQPGSAVGALDARLAAVVVALGLGSSFLASALFNVAVSRLSRTLVGPLLALEPGFALAYAHLLTWRAPGTVELAGELLLLAGVVLALLASRHPRERPVRGTATVAMLRHRRAVTRRSAGAGRTEGRPRTAA